VFDRINLKAKLRELITVEFTSSERDLVNEVFAVETWEDVLEACRKLYAHALENQTKSPSIPNNSNEEQDGNMDPTAETSETSSDKPRSMDDNDEGEAESQKSAGSSNEENEEQDESDEVETLSNEGGNDYDQTESQTDKAFRDNEHKLLDQDENGRVVDVCNGFTETQISEMMLDYSYVEKCRDHIDAHCTYEYKATRYRKSLDDSFDDFMNENKKIVQIMAKESSSDLR
jgi:hypothetical protein